MIDLYRIVDKWIKDNIQLIHDSIDKKRTLGDNEIKDLVSRFKYDVDLHFVTEYLFKQLSYETLDYCYRKNYNLNVFQNATYKNAQFASLNEYAREISADDLLQKFPFLHFG